MVSNQVFFLPIIKKVPFFDKKVSLTLHIMC